MAEVDSLEIKIQSDAEKASQSIDKLVKKLDSVAKSLGSINTSAMSASINELTGKLSAINGKGFSDLNKSAKEAETTIKKVSDTAKKGIKSKISFDTKDYQTVIENLNKKFANAGKGFKAGDTFAQMQKQADSLSARLEKLLQKEDKIVSVGKMSPESSVFQNLQYDINAIMNNLDTLYSKMGQMPQKTKELSNINIHRWNENQEAETLTKPRTVKIPTTSMGYNKEAVAGVESIYQKMYGNAEKAAQKTDSLGNRVEALKAKLKELSGQGLNFGDAKFDETYRKLNHANEELKKHKSNLEQTGNTGKTFSERLKNALKNVNSQTTKTSGSIGKLASSIKRALHSVKQSSDGFGGFAKKIGLLYAKIYVLRRGFNALFGTVKKSMDYVETLNYFNAAFEQIAKKADLKSFKEMGYDSAEAYYNSFSERAEQLTQKMSGFKIEESGMAVSTGEKSFGIDPSLLMQNQAMFGQMANSMGIASETAANLSSVFTRFGADIASLKNEDFQKVWQNMASGMTGMSRAVDKYGMNIREANLQQTLSNIGISTSISKLTQQEKVLLRTIVMLDSSRAAWGDLAKTMNQPANQLRLLQSNWSNLSRTIGNIFLPIVAKVLPYINAVTIMLQRFAEQIVKFFGFDKKFDWGGLGATGGADFDIDFGDAEDDTAGMADNMDKTAKKAKKAVDNLQGFDIINKLQDPNEGKDSDGAGGNGGKGLSSGDLSKLSGALDKLLSEYDKAWNKAFKGMENKANKLANKMQKALVDAWNKGDFSELGKKVAVWINKGLAKIPWDKIKATVKKIARSIATFLNGFIGELNWSLIGKTFAEGLNTVIEGAYEFWATFNWLKFGKSLGMAIDSFIKKFNAKKFGKLLGAKLRGIMQTAYGMVTTFVENDTFTTLGGKIGDAINGFLEDMGKVDKRTGLTGWQELGKTISKSITGILDTINTALSTVKWAEVGKAIADFLVNIDWWGILGKLLTVLGNTLSAIVKTAISAIAENPSGMIKALTGAFALIFTVKNLMSGFSFLTNTFKSIFGLNMQKGLSSVVLDGSSIKITGMEKAGGGISGLITKIGSLKTAFAALKSGGLISGTTSMFGQLTNAISLTAGGAGTLRESLSVAMSGINQFKLGLGLVAVIAAETYATIKLLKTGIDAYYDTDFEPTLLESEKKKIEGYKNSISEANSAIQSTKKIIEETNKSASETPNGDNIEDLKNKYFELSKKANPTALEIERMKKYSKQLNEMIPGFNKNVDKQTGAFNGSKKELNNLINGYKRYKKAISAKESNEKLLSQFEENEKKIKSLTGTYKKAQNDRIEASKRLQELYKQGYTTEDRVVKNQIAKMGKFAEKENEARDALQEMKKTQKEVNKQFEKNKNVIEFAKVSTKNYKNATNNLKDSLKNLGVKGKEQKGIIGSLKKSVESGEISWKDYKKITDGTYTSTDELYGAIQKIAGKDFSTKLKATVEGKKDVEDTKKAIANIKSKNITVKATADTAKATYKINDLTKGRTVKVTAVLGKTKDFAEKVRKALSGSNFKMSAAQIFPDANQIKKYFDGITKTKEWKNMKMFAPAGGRSIDVNKKTKTVSIPKELDLGGLISTTYKSKGYNINLYAAGGFPEDGWFRANHGEIMGRFDNGKSVVANNQQITDGIAQAVAPAVYSAVKAAINEQDGGRSDKVIILDKSYKQITEGIIGEVNSMTKSRGKSPILGVN